MRYSACLGRAFLLPVLLSILWLSLASSTWAATLQRGNGAEPETLDVHLSSGVPEANIQRDLFEGLVTEAADGRLQAGVAERWEISADSKIYTFYLRKDSLWSNGEAVTADDFVFAYRRALQPLTASDYAFILWPIAGAEAMSKGKLEAVKQLGVQALDKHTLQITLERPTPYFLQLLTHHMAYPVPRNVVAAEGKQWAKAGKLVSNGAYQLAEWQPQAHIKLVKNPHYRRANEIAIDTVFYIPTEDRNTELKRFRAGELDMTYAIPTEQLAWIKKNAKAAYRNAPYIGTYYYALNLAKPPFKDQPKLRRALALALDRDILTQKISKAGEQAAYGWIPSGMKPYTPQTIDEKALNSTERRQLAQQLYAESGYSKDKPLNIELLYNTSDNHKKMAIAVAAMWKQVLGVKTQLRNEEWKVYLNSRKQGDFEVIRAGWIGDYNDPYTFLSLFKSDVGEMNSSAYHNDNYDALLKAAENEQDANKRMDLLQQAEQQLLQDLPIIPVYHYQSQHLVNPKIQGWQDNLMDIHPTQYLSISAETMN